MPRLTVFAMLFLAATAFASFASPAQATAVGAGCGNPVDVTDVENLNCFALLGLPTALGFTAHTNCPPDGSGGRACEADLCLFLPEFACSYQAYVACDVGAGVPACSTICAEPHNLPVVQNGSCPTVNAAPLQAPATKPVSGGLVVATPAGPFLVAA